jgi:hypothetical protein
VFEFSIRRHAPRSQAAHFDRNKIPAISGTGH